MVLVVIQLYSWHEALSTKLAAIHSYQVLQSGVIRYHNQAGDQKEPGYGLCMYILG